VIQSDLEREIQHLMQMIRGQSKRVAVTGRIRCRQAALAAGRPAQGGAGRAV